MCILLVEDEWLIRSMVAQVLREDGFAVHEAGDSDQASALIVEDPAAYTLLVTDIHMPGDLDGIGVAHLLRARRPDIPVIYATARPDALNALQPFGAKEILLCKPFAMSALLTAVRRLLGQRDAHVC